LKILYLFIRVILATIIVSPVACRSVLQFKWRMNSRVVVLFRSTTLTIWTIILFKKKKKNIFLYNTKNKNTLLMRYLHWSRKESLECVGLDLKQLIHGLSNFKPASVIEEQVVIAINDWEGIELEFDERRKRGSDKVFFNVSR
jgi:hypothetical protein